MSALTRREKQQRTRSSLLRAAAELFSQAGLEGTSVEQVQAAGYTKGAFYANFKSKEELFLVILDERFARELERLDRALAGTQEPFREAEAVAGDFIHFASDKQWQRLYFQFVAHAARDEEFRQELAARQRAMRERLTDLFCRWNDGTGHAPRIPLQDITAMFFFMADGFLVDQMIDPSLEEELYATMVGVFLRGLEAMASEPHQARTL